jgi:3-oxoadipate enol-lactonase
VTRARKPDIYWRVGGRGPALVLVNGWSASGLAWPRSWVRELEDSFRVIRVDNRGSGYSRFAPTPFTMNDMADDVAAVLDAVEADRAIVAGMSMGGMIAQEFAFRHPQRLSGLVLIATRPPAPAYAIPKAGSVMIDLMGSPRKGETLATYFTRLWSTATGTGFAQREPEAIAELVRQIVERPTPRVMLMHQLRAVTGWGHAQRLREIEAPAAVVHGTEDRLIDVVNGQRLAAMIPDARYVELDGVGHLPPLEAPDQLLDVIAEVGSDDPLAVPSTRLRAAASA